jgi:hypothetical protein
LYRRHGPTTFSVVIVNEVSRTGFAHVSSLSARKDAGKFLVCRVTGKVTASTYVTGFGVNQAQAGASLTGLN